MKKTVIILLIACLLLTGCTGAGDSADDTSATTLRNRAEKVFPLPAGDSVLDIARVENALLLLAQRGEERYLALARYSAGEEGRVSLDTATALELERAESLIDISAGGDGCFYALALGEGAGEYHILQISAEGELLYIQELTVTGDEPALGMLVTKAGERLLLGYEAVWLYPLNGGEPYSLPLPGGLISAELTDMGPVLYLSGGDGDGELPCFAVDTAERSIRALERAEEVYVMATCQGFGGEYIISDGRSLLQYDPDSHSMEELCLWNPSRYAQDSLLTAVRLGDSAFLCAIDGESQLLLTWMEEYSPAELSRVKVAVLLPPEGKWLEEYCGDLISQAQLSGDYEYVPEYYTAEEGDRLLTELAAGGKHDLLLFFEGVNTAGGAFEDLYPYIDADPELSRDSFLPNLLNATAVNGKLYQLWNHVCINTITADASLVGDRTDYTCADYNALLEANPEYGMIFPPFVDMEWLLGNVAELGISVFADRDTATCDFTNEQFKELLRWCAAMPAQWSEGVEDTHMLMRRIIGSVREDFAGYEDGVVTHEPKRFVGFPNGQGGYHYYSSEFEAVTMAIPATSGDKQGAWAFIRAQLVFENQAGMGEAACIPVNYEAAKYIASAYTSPQSMELLEDLFERTKYAENFLDTGLKDIIMSCAEAYLNGDKTLDETVENIQSRASIYLSERYG